MLRFYGIVPIKGSHPNTVSRHEIPWGKYPPGGVLLWRHSSTGPLTIVKKNSSSVLPGNPGNAKNEIPPPYVLVDTKVQLDCFPKAGPGTSVICNSTQPEKNGNVRRQKICPISTTPPPHHPSSWLVIELADPAHLRVLAHSCRHGWICTENLSPLG